MRIKSFSKLNLFLNIKEKRNDGFHNIESVFQAVSLFDTLNIELDRKLSLHYGAGKFPVSYSVENDILYKTYNAFAKMTTLPPVKMSLIKNIPMGAGMGGGSADAAALIRYFMKKKLINLNQSELEQLASTIGSDVPFFINGGAALVEKKGEIITPISSPHFLSTLHYVVIYPEVSVSTVEAYKENCNIQPDSNFALFQKAIQDKNFSDLTKYCYNGFQEKTLSRYSQINEAYKLLREFSAFTLLSGSGSTVFSVFNSHKEAKTCYNICRKDWQHCWLLKPVFY